MLENTPGTLDIGCYPIGSPANAEYCEFPQGGTSVASPLFAGVMAVIDSARLSTGKPFIGFANPTLYKLSVGSNVVFRRTDLGCLQTGSSRCPYRRRAGRLRWYGLDGHRH